MVGGINAFPLVLVLVLGGVDAGLLIAELVPDYHQDQHQQPRFNPPFSAPRARSASMKGVGVVASEREMVVLALAPSRCETDERIGCSISNGEAEADAGQRKMDDAFWDGHGVCTLQPRHTKAKFPPAIAPGVAGASTFSASSALESSPAPPMDSGRDDT